MPLTPGQRLASYEIVGALGAGGMGEVYRARDSRLGRDVALKILPPDVVSEPGRLERFDREARAIAALNHPHIITIFSTEEADGLRFMTMELVDGTTLNDLLMSTGMPIAQFLELAMPLADALAAAHQKQITHRDLKPANVMISKDGRLKVLDFGLARVDEMTSSESTVALGSPVTEHGVILGTVPYMSPEQVEGRPLDPRSDLFSLGVIFYELLSGARPFKGDSSVSVMSAILRDTPERLSSKRTDIPDSLERLIDRLLAKRADDRVQTARDVYNELRSVRPDARSEGRSHAGSDAGSKGRSERSVAVLPFADLSEKKDQEWFCDGVAEEILNALAALPGLRVAARASSFSFKGKNHDLRAIGEALNVATVLEGSVRRFGDRVRITTQMSDAREDRQLWSERFDRELTDIFNVQDEIARAVVDRLSGAARGSAPIVRKPTSNIHAYELLLKGRAQLVRRGPAILNAAAFFEQAIAVDPSLAEAHAGLATAYGLMSIYGMRASQDVIPKAIASIERSLAINPDEPDALATLANIRYGYDWDGIEAARHTDHALAVDPDHLRGLVESALMLAAINLDPVRPEARQLILSRLARAREVDPLNAWVMAIQAMTLTILGDADAGVAAATLARSTDAGTFTAHGSLVASLNAAGRYDESLAAADAAFAIFGRNPSILAEVAAVHANRNDRAAARAIFDELTERSSTQYIGAGMRAAVAASAGDAVEALRLLQLAIAGRDSYLTMYKFGAWRPLRAIPACNAVLEQIAFIKDGLR